RSSAASAVVRPLISDCLGGAAQQRRRPHAGYEQDREPGGPQRAAGGRTAAGGPVAAGGRAGCGREGCEGETGEGDQRSCGWGGKGRGGTRRDRIGQAAGVAGGRGCAALTPSPSRS